jgi:hypothetical protein
MKAYQFYWRDDIKGFELIGILPERRVDPGRITEDSIMRLGRSYIGEEADSGRMLFIQITLYTETGEISKPLVWS